MKGQTMNDDIQNETSLNPNAQEPNEPQNEELWHELSEQEIAEWKERRKINKRINELEKSLRSACDKKIFLIKERIRMNETYARQIKKIDEKLKAKESELDELSKLFNLPPLERIR